MLLRVAEAYKDSENYTEKSSIKLAPWKFQNHEFYGGLHAPFLGERLTELIDRSRTNIREGLIYIGIIKNTCN